MTVKRCAKGCVRSKGLSGWTKTIFFLCDSFVLRWRILVMKQQIVPADLRITLIERGVARGDSPAGEGWIEGGGGGVGSPTN